MKILMATMGLDIGGAETHILELAKEMKRRGNDVAVASNGGVYVSELEAAGIRHYKVPMHRRNAGLMIKSGFMMADIIKKEKPDVVHAHARIPGFICGILKKRLGFPFVTTAHWVFDTAGALRKLTNWGDRTVAVSDDIKEYLEVNYGIPEEHIYVTINGIDAEKFSPDISGESVRREFLIPADAPVISHVSRMDESREMAAAKLIESAENIAGAVKGAVILIAGAGNMFDELKARADAVNARLGYDCVIMAGARTDVNEIIAAGDIFVGVSRAALEAMAASKPVVIAGNEGYQGIFTEDKLAVALEGNFCCRGCEMMTAETLARDVIECLSMTAEEKKAAGEYCRAVILEHYSVGRMAEDTLRAYRDAIPPKKVVMSGYYGFGNAGDEAILESVKRSVEKCLPGAEITVLSGDPEGTKKVYGCNAVKRFSPVQVWKAIRKCDLLVSGGGSLLQDTTSTRSIVYYLAIIRLAQMMGKKVMLYANGIGPVRGEKNRRRVGYAVSRADIVTLRDADSLEELKSMNALCPVTEVTADPVYLLEPAGEEKVAEILKRSGVPEGGFIAVSVRNWAGLEEFAPKLAAVCDGLHEKYGENIVFIPMMGAADENAAKKIISHMTAPAYEISGGCHLELMGVVGRADMVVSMRLHSVIFAGRMAVPVAGINYDPKVESALDILEMPSLGTVSGFDADAALRTACDLFGHREEKHAVLCGKRDTLRRMAEENEKYLRQLME